MKRLEKNISLKLKQKQEKLLISIWDKHQPTDLVELANDKNFFESAMKLMYDCELHPDTMV